MREIETLVIGGGISGLSSAWQLAALGNPVEVWEAEQQAGGKIQTQQDQGYTTEQAASMVLNFRPEVREFLHQSGLDQHKLLRTPTSKRYLIHHGQLQEMPMKAGGMLFSPIWSLPGKIRLMLEPLIVSRASDNESVADFIRRRFGNEMLDKALSAYISGTLASDPELADSTSVLPHLTRLERRYGSLTVGALMHKLRNKKSASITEGFSFRGGMSTMVDELAGRLGENLRTGYRIQSIEPDSRGWQVSAVTPQGEQHCHAERLIICTPASVTAGLLRPHNKPLTELLDEIEYAPLSVIHLAYAQHSLQHDALGTGFLTPWREKLKLNGSMWMHNLFEHRAPEGQVLLSNYLGGSRNPHITQWPEQQRIDLAHHELKSLLGIRGEPLWSKVNHHAQALPLYHGHYAQRQQAIAKAVETTPGLYLQANYLGGVSIRDRILCAQKLAAQLNRVATENCPVAEHISPAKQGRIAPYEAPAS